MTGEHTHLHWNLLILWLWRMSGLSLITDEEPWNDFLKRYDEIHVFPIFSCRDFVPHSDGVRSSWWRRGLSDEYHMEAHWSHSFSLCFDVIMIFSDRIVWHDNLTRDVELWRLIPDYRVEKVVGSNNCVQFPALLHFLYGRVTLSSSKRDSPSCDADVVSSWARLHRWFHSSSSRAFTSNFTLPLDFNLVVHIKVDSSKNTDVRNRFTMCILTNIESHLSGQSAHVVKSFQNSEKVVVKIKSDFKGVRWRSLHLDPISLIFVTDPES